MSILNIVEEEKREVVDTTSVLYGKTFCITGTFNVGSRSWISNKLEEKGGIPVSSVTKKTDVLFAGEKAGSKLTKAQELGITIYNEKDLENIIK